MLGNRKIIVDTWAEIWDLLEPYADGNFWKWPAELDPEAVYIVGRVVLKENWQAITDWATQHPGHVVFSNPAEGSQTMWTQLHRLRIVDHVQDGRIGLLASGDLEPPYTYCKTDCYCSNIVEYLENLRAHESYPQVYHKQNKPYDFLFLNGRLRPHRKYLIDAMRDRKLLDRALWTNLQNQVDFEWTSRLPVQKLEQVRLLPSEYEIEPARSNLESANSNTGFVKYQLFDNIQEGCTWGDAIVNPAPYIDTYFSVVSETIFDYPYTFRTEKTWKPMIMGHPFVIASNRGFYRDLHLAGFQTFGKLIDETFDQIDDPKDRADRIVDVVADICYNGAASFLEAAKPICKYNYQQLREHNRRERAELPERLAQYINNK
jgi:uncharacterized protein YggL (DUF469 family)